MDVPLGAPTFGLAFMPTVRTLLAISSLAALGSCARGVPIGANELPLRSGAPALYDPVAVYTRAGLIASGAPLPFVGWVRFLAGESDSAAALVALSFPARAFSFVREGTGYRARYDVSLEFRRGGESVRRVQTSEAIRVNTLRETTREEESVIFQHVVALAPGAYTLLVVVRDSAGSREGTTVARIAVPRVGPGTDGVVSSPMIVHRAAPRRSIGDRPRLVANARSTALMGRDSVIRVYVEGYTQGPSAQIRLRVRGSAGHVSYDTVLRAGQPGGSMFGQLASIPVSRLGIGLSHVEVLAAAGNAVLSVAPILVGLGEGLVVTTFEEALDYLRWFGSSERVRLLREEAPSRQPAAWTRFLRETDPVPSTEEHEGLRDYFARLEVANARFREEPTPGWLTDRGMVFVALGEPDRVREPRQEESSGPPTQQWEYDTPRLRLVFVDRSGRGEWRLTAAAEAEFRNATRQRTGAER